jgi:hypothetical protein
MKRISTSVLFLLVSLVSLGWTQQIPKQKTLYDDFSGRWLDPGKWQTSNAANGGWWNPQCLNALECVREIQGGKLFLMVKNFGNADSDSGVQWSESGVYFPNPNAVTSITANVTVRSFSGIGCMTNSTDRTHTQVMMGGTFFNTGTGAPFDDVTGLLIIWVDTYDPFTMNVAGWWGWEDQGYWNGIKSYPIGTPLTGTIKWDKANHQFIASVNAEGEVPATVTMPYYLTETSFPANAIKHIDAEAHTLNCTTAQTKGQVSATYDNVIINR